MATLPVSRSFTVALLVLLLLVAILEHGAAFAAAPSPPPLQKTIVVTGATGRAGSRLVKHLLEESSSSSSPDGRGINVVALVRNAIKAKFMFGVDDSCDLFETEASSLTILEADFGDPSSIESVLSDVLNNKENDNHHVRLFLACGNVPDQATLELNVARAVSKVAGGGDGDKSNCFCAKLSTAQPLVEDSIGPGAVHRTIEEELQRLYSKSNCAILRPNIFSQMLDPTQGGSLLGVDMKNNDKEEEEDDDDDESTCYHPFADCPISVIDGDDVAACAASILLQDDLRNKHGGKIYELTGPEAITLSNQFAQAVSKLRSGPISIKPCSSMEDHIVSAGLPPAAIERIAPFLKTIASYKTVTDTVQQLTGRPARSISDYFVSNNPRPFLPKTFRRLIATSQHSSFREAAKMVTASLDTEVDAMEDDEMLVRVQAAGVNGGADTFAVTRAAADAKDFPLGNEGTGVVVLAGKNVTRFQPGDTAVFVASGAYGEYLRVKEARCAAVPDASIASPSELSALRISALTALVALTRTCPVVSGDVVLISACCGGTGHFAVQIAKASGATVIGTVGSTVKTEFARDIGVDRVVDLSTESLGKVLQEEFPQGIDVAYEGVGGSLLRSVFDNLANGGRILIVGSISQYPHNQQEDVESHRIEGLDDILDVFRSGKTVELNHDKKTKHIIGNVWGDLFMSGEMEVYRDRVFDWNANGKLRVLLDPREEFEGVESVCDAVEYMLSRRSVGKVNVKISD